MQTSFRTRDTHEKEANALPKVVGFLLRAMLSCNVNGSLEYFVNLGYLHQFSFEKCLRPPPLNLGIYDRN